MEHASTKISPAYLNFGRQPEPVVFLRKHLESPEPLRPQDPEIWLDRVKRLPALHDLIKRHLENATTRQARYYNRNKRDISYKLDDLVLRRNHVLSSAAQNFAAKLATKFIGPCKIIKVYSPLVYEIEDVESKRVMKVHISDLKKYLPPRVLTPNQPPVLSQDEENGAPSSPRNAMPRSQSCRTRPDNDAESHKSDGEEEPPPTGSSRGRAPLGTRGRQRGRPRAAGRDHTSVRAPVATSPPRTEPTNSGLPLSDAREGVPERMLGEAEKYVAIRQVDRAEVAAEEPAAAQAKTVPCNRGCFRGGVHLNARCATLVSSPTSVELLPLSVLPSTPEQRRVKSEPRTPHSSSTIFLVRSPQTPLLTLKQRLTDPSTPTRLPLCASLTNAAFSLPMTMSPRTESTSARSNTSRAAIATSSVAPDSVRSDSPRS